MPTFREDLHLGHKVPLIEADDIKNSAVTTEKINDTAVTTEKIGTRAVTAEKIADKNVTTEKIKDGSVTTEKLAKYAVTREKLHQEVIDDVKNLVNTSIKDLQHQIDSLEIHGVAVSEEFGDDTHISISQKTLTNSINKIWDRLDAIVGETQRGINMTVSPKYFTSESGADVYIEASSADASSAFEYIAFYANNELITEYTNVDTVSFNTHIDSRTVIKCIAKIMGMEYMKTETIDKVTSFYIGGGDNASDIIDAEHHIEITNGSISGPYEIELEDGNHIIIAINSSYDTLFDRADLNGFEIPFTISEVTVDNIEYTIYKTENLYREGTYTIYINR